MRSERRDHASHQHAINREKAGLRIEWDAQICLASLAELTEWRFVLTAGLSVQPLKQRPGRDGPYGRIPHKRKPALERPHATRARRSWVERLIELSVNGGGRN